MKDHQPSPELLAALASLAAEDIAAAPPPDLEVRLLAEFAAGPQPARWRVPVWVPAAAALVVACTVLLHDWGPEPQDSGGPYVQVPFVAPPAPYERTEVVREVVPIATLIAAGFELHVADAGGPLMADVLVGQDGRALAIRLVTGSVSNSGRKSNQ